jgi:hypothetical protein
MNEREAVERLSEWLWPNCDRHFLTDRAAFITPSDAGPDDLAIYFAPFTANGERELLTAVQDRWGRPALSEERQGAGGAASVRWGWFRGALRRAIRARYGEEERDMGTPVDLLLAFLAPGDIARAVDAVLREYPDT